MKIPCIKCNTVTELEVYFKVEIFVCPSCKTVYQSTSNNDFKYVKKLKDDSFKSDFKIKN